MSRQDSNSRRQTSARAGLATHGGGLSFSRWFGDHMDAIVDSLSKLIHRPWQTLLTALVITMALVPPAALYVLIQSAEKSFGRIVHSSDLSVYFELGTNVEQTINAQTQVIDYPEVRAVRFLSEDQALEEFKAFSGLENALHHLDQNPLPATLLVSPNPDSANPEAVRLLVEKLEALPGVSQVVVDFDWLQRLAALIRLLTYFALFLVIFLGVGIVLIVGNTIRLEIENRRDEIKIVKLVGGTNAFVRRPLVYLGIWFGLVGGLLSWLIVYLMTEALQGPVAEFASQYSDTLSLYSPAIMELGTMALAGVFLGWSGSHLAMLQYLKRI